MAEAKTESVTYIERRQRESRETFTTYYGIASNDLAVLGLQEMILYFWFDIKELGILSMLSLNLLHFITCQRDRGPGHDASEKQQRSRDRKT